MQSLSAILHRDAVDLHAWRETRTRILRLRRSATAPAGNAPKSFSELAGLAQTTPGYAEQASNYHHFLASVSTALGGEAAPDEVANAAAAAFRVLQTLPAPPELVPEAGKPPGLGKGSGPPGLGSAPANVSKEAMKQARMLLTGNGGTAASGVAASAASAACVSAFGKVLEEAPLREMLRAHAPLAAWLRAHRANPAREAANGGGGKGKGGGKGGGGKGVGKGGGGVGGGKGGSGGGHAGTDARGAASASIRPSELDAYHRLLDSVAEAERAEEEAAEAASAAAAAERAEREERAAAAVARTASFGGGGEGGGPSGGTSGGASAASGGEGGGGNGAAAAAREGTIGWVRCHMMEARLLLMASDGF